MPGDLVGYIVIPVTPSHSELKLIQEKLLLVPCKILKLGI